MSELERPESQGEALSLEAREFVVAKLAEILVLDLQKYPEVPAPADREAGPLEPPA